MILAVVLFWRRCVSLWKEIQKRTRLEISGSVIFTTLFQNTSTQILECVAAQYNAGLCPEPGRVAYNASVHTDCFYKVEQFQLYKDSLSFWLTACTYVSASDDSDVSFEPL